MLHTPTRQILTAALLALAALLLADLALLNALPGRYRVDVGTFRDKFYLYDTYRQETLDGASYRWTRARSALSFDGVGVAQAALTLHLGGRPAPGEVRLSIAGVPWANLTAEVAPRQYRLLLPPRPPQSLLIGIESETFQPPGDPRRLGVKIDAVGIDLLRGTLAAPLPAQLVAQYAALLLLTLTLLRLLVPRWLLALAIVAGAIGLASVPAVDLLAAHAYLPRIALAALALAGITIAVLPPFERWFVRQLDYGGAGEARLLWGLTLGAVVLRLVPVLYPTFGGQDLGRNLDRLFTTIGGQLVIIAPSGEFAKGLTIYPPGPYLGLMPLGVVSGDYEAWLQGALAIMDGFSALFVALLARRLGGSAAAGRLALVWYAASYTAFACLVYSFSAQTYGQWFTAPMALLLLGIGGAASGRERALWTTTLILLLFAALSHIGVAFLAFGWMGMYLLIDTIVRRRVAWRMWLGVAGCAALALVMLYIFIVQQTLSHASAAILPASERSLFPGFRWLLISGARLAYSDLGLALLIPGLVLAVGRVGGDLARRVVPLSMLGTLLVYLLIDLTLNVQVRYFYFLLPLALASIGLALGWLAARGRLGALGAWALTAAVALPTVVLWLSATFGDGKISMTPLTH